MTGPSRTFEFLRRPGAPHDDHETSREYVVWGASDVGLVRETNEDQYVIATTERQLTVNRCSMPGNDGASRAEHTGTLVMVADGMGGQEHGEVASAMIIDGMLQYALSLMPSLQNQSKCEEQALADGLTEAVLRSQKRMAAFIARRAVDGDMGSTLTMGFVQWPALYLVHVGDSRAYLLRSKQLFRLTRDHNLAEEMVRTNAMTAEEARLSNFTSVLTNCVSTSVDEIHVELHQIELKAGDRVLFCTDGLYGMVTDAQLRDRLCAIESDEDVTAAVVRMIEDARDGGGDDNITAVVLACK